MRIEQSIAYSYLRLSREEAQRGESSSITNQRMIVRNYCKQNGITIIREFADDGYSGSNFNRPDFQKMLQEIAKGKVNTVITKDLSRLGRDMRESSYYAEQYFPEHGVHYIAIADNFDSESENIMAPFQFAMNEVYLRDGSRKVKDVLRNKREGGLYCACPPYGYKKEEHNKNRLIPDEITAPIVKRIFDAAANGDSSRKIAMDLNTDGIIPPLKYRVLYRDEFSDEGAARASDFWNYTTVKRILKNDVYLGHTLLGKTKKASVKSKKKIAVPKEEWAITENTHEPLVTKEIFDLAGKNLGKGSRNYKSYEHIRKSIFSGIVFCEKCGHALCSCGTVYNGEREKYWYLSCINKRKDISNPCDGVRIKYSDLVQLITDSLNEFLNLSDAQINKIVSDVIAEDSSERIINEKKMKIQKANSRLEIIDKIIPKLYLDNAEGRLDDERLYKMVSDLQKESEALKQTVSELSNIDYIKTKADNYKMFFELTKNVSHIDVLDRETLTTFIERIEVGAKVFPEGKTKATHRNSPFKQSVRIYYKFIGDAGNDPICNMPYGT